MFVIPSATVGDYEVLVTPSWSWTNFAFAAYEFPSGTYTTDVGYALETSMFTDTLTLWGGGYTPIDDYYIYAYCSGNSQIGSTTLPPANIDADSERSGGATVGHDSAYTETFTGDTDLLIGGVGVRRTDSAFVAPTVFAQHYESPNLPPTPVPFDFTIHNTGSFVVVAVAVGYWGATSITINPITVPEVRELTVKMRDHSFKAKTPKKEVKFVMDSNPT
jgi:hypothetical protein